MFWKRLLPSSRAVPASVTQTLRASGSLCAVAATFLVCASHSRATDGTSLSEARSRAKLLHEVFEGTLQAIHRQYFREESGQPIPSRVLDDVFARMARRSQVEARWLAVNAQAMSVDHQPKDDFEKEAARELARGKVEFESIAEGQYRRATPIALFGSCLKCHAPAPMRQDVPRYAGLVISIPLLATAVMNLPEEPLFVAQPLTKDGEFTAGIEGPNCDAAGNIFAVNFARQGTIGKVTPDGKGEVFVELPNNSVGNGIVFDAKGTMFVADYVNHNVLAIDPRTKAISVFAHNAEMNQPNDLAIAPDGTLYASDPNWKASTGQLWRIGLDGKVTRVAAEMGTTNGIEVSPDGRSLYVNESVQRNVWSFAIAADGSLSNKKLIKQFPDHGFDGMRCDVDGNLYITRYGKGTVVKMTPAGEILKEIDVLGASPSNLCFGGPDGRTVYVTEVKHTRLVQFRVDRPGLAWHRQQKR